MEVVKKRKRNQYDKIKGMSKGQIIKEIKEIKEKIAIAEEGDKFKLLTRLCHLRKYGREKFGLTDEDLQMENSKYQNVKNMNAEQVIKEIKEIKKKIDKAVDNKSKLRLQGRLQQLRQNGSKLGLTNEELERKYDQYQNVKNMNAEQVIKEIKEIKEKIAKAVGKLRLKLRDRLYHLRQYGRELGLTNKELQYRYKKPGGVTVKLEEVTEKIILKKDDNQGLRELHKLRLEPDLPPEELQFEPSLHKFPNNQNQYQQKSTSVASNLNKKQQKQKQKQEQKEQKNNQQQQQDFIPNNLFNPCQQFQSNPYLNNNQYFNLYSNEQEEQEFGNYKQNPYLNNKHELKKQNSILGKFSPQKEQEMNDYEIDQYFNLYSNEQKNDDDQQKQQMHHPVMKKIKKETGKQQFTKRVLTNNSASFSDSNENSM